MRTLPESLWMESSACASTAKVLIGNGTGRVETAASTIHAATTRPNEPPRMPTMTLMSEPSAPPPVITSAMMRMIRTVFQPCRTGGGAERTVREDRHCIDVLVAADVMSALVRTWIVDCSYMTPYSLDVFHFALIILREKSSVVITQPGDYRG